MCKFSPHKNTQKNNAHEAADLYVPIMRPDDDFGALWGPPHGCQMFREPWETWEIGEREEKAGPLGVCVRIVIQVLPKW